ncbi:hypothetical protein [Pontibacter beigongshangensis]|uniref:hypothetical protein n=1 Tax=Pontibacter beigongshangensis TaxID=2574733 RepID=UPI00164F5D98|nr:hypothetical protein [Pontibacter beigongshangensis]
MKTSRLLPLIAILLAFTFFTGCKKDKNEPEPELTAEDRLTAKSWQGDKVLALGMDAYAIPQLADMLPDIKTMVLVFKKDGTYTATYSEKGQSVPLSGTWELRKEDTSIYFDLLSTFGLNEEVDIKTLTATSLILTTTVTVPNNPLQIPLEVHFVSN